MIYEILQIISEELNDYLDENAVSLANIADADVEGSSSGNFPDIALSLINLQEEFALKNIRNDYVNNSSVTYKNPKVYLNLFILFSVNKSTYTESLKSLTKLIAFFQGKKVFTQANSNYQNVDGIENIKSFKFITELYTPTFEELNFIWGTLGGKQKPSVLYKITLLEIEREVIAKEGSVISEMQRNSLINN
ncbi:hypothetical protein BTO06_18035 [Tenacibaculum sp. SZ-18]|uniref:DUF4255 domain-containing protein n=1 Tax=Tenacibaculum sp. SZ-18 TaxID=754423 RepID=UPI000C2D4A91|nr:DUF4255 domain-containing protein [Tenacibaculum sp. SZ-18]AUC16930.1 hypothetical protein BTO06_18035 [Tenacibaculum sp. SZ-18]